MKAREFECRLARLESVVSAIAGARGTKALGEGENEILERVIEEVYGEKKSKRTSTEEDD